MRTNTLIWTIIGLIVLALGAYIIFAFWWTSVDSIAEAREFAQGSSCTEIGTLGEGGSFNETDNTWDIPLSVPNELQQTGCTSVCAVSDRTGRAALTWRCPAPDGSEDGGTQDNLIRVTSPQQNATVASPLTVEGEARGTWYFEASFGVRVLDANGTTLGEAPAEAQGDWMTEEFVPFNATVVFSTPTTDTGTLVLEKANPSGLPENADERRIPIRFNGTQGATRDVLLYYYNPAEDEDATGNIQCSRDGLVAVERRIPTTQTPIQDTIRLLLQGGLTSEERNRGITTEFPLSGFELEGASLTNGTLTLEFNDPQNATSGGSCRAGILWFQIEATAEQFVEVDDARFRPETLFQP